MLQAQHRSLAGVCLRRHRRSLEGAAKGDPRLVAVDLWRRARRAREAAKGVACFAALSSSGAAFAQLQANAQAAELWRRAQDLEDAALAAWEQCGEDDDVRRPRAATTTSLSPR